MKTTVEIPQHEKARHGWVKQPDHGIRFEVEPENHNPYMKIEFIYRGEAASMGFVSLRELVCAVAAMEKGAA